MPAPVLNFLSTAGSTNSPKKKKITGLMFVTVPFRTIKPSVSRWDFGGDQLLPPFPTLFGLPQFLFYKN
jgi:hypothetical protein